MLWFLLGMEEPHILINQLSRARGESLAALSRLIGRNAAYLHQFITRRSPTRLGEDERLKLAQHFGIDERRLGAREPWRPT
ncbi:MAG: hypothetical protein ABIS14_12755 [Sphingomonas sp.]